MWSARPTYFVANFLHPNDLSVTLGFDQICSLRTISESNHGRVRSQS